MQFFQGVLSDGGGVPGERALQQSFGFSGTGEEN